eukprot:5467846-Lingulodinium_polyedra.AAC.1
MVRIMRGEACSPVRTQHSFVPTSPESLWTAAPCFAGAWMGVAPDARIVFFFTSGPRGRMRRASGRASVGEAVVEPTVSAPSDVR